MSTSAFDQMPVAYLAQRKEEIRVGRLTLTPKQQIALLDLVMEAKRALARAEELAVKAVIVDLFDPEPMPQPVRLPGDAHG